MESNDFRNCLNYNYMMPFVEVCYAVSWQAQGYGRQFIILRLLRPSKNDGRSNDKFSISRLSLVFLLSFTEVWHQYIYFNKSTAVLILSTARSRFSIEFA